MVERLNIHLFITYANKKPFYLHIRNAETQIGIISIQKVLYMEHITIKYMIPTMVVQTTWNSNLKCIN